jgi:hypothetical protein
VNILLLACYELGHQPLSLAWPLAVLEHAGFRATGIDLAVAPFPHDMARQAQFIGIAVPMHTAMRLGVQAAIQVRALNPTAHICFYGLYAWLNADYLLNIGADDAPIADSVIAGEYEESLSSLLQALAGAEDTTSIPGVSTAAASASPTLVRLKFPVPERSKLPPLSHYARYVDKDQQHLAGYVEASRGCLHTCHHCPVVPVYNGRFFVVPLETVLTDIRQQVAAGARHITFGDPDFLNGPGHALKIARAHHSEFPGVTFDFTTKVEHILQYRSLLAEFRAMGAGFVVTAFEATNDGVLVRLQKGHTVADMDSALAILADADLPIRPTWVPFTPWTTLEDYIALLEWIRTRGLIPHVPPVQLSIRLLVPPRSALLTQPDRQKWLGPLDAANFTYQWRHPDPCLDELQLAVATLAQQAGDDPYHTFAAIERLAYTLAGRPIPHWSPPITPEPAPPRLTEDWFC